MRLATVALLCAAASATEPSGTGPLAMLETFRAYMQSAFNNLRAHFEFLVVGTDLKTHYEAANAKFESYKDDNVITREKWEDFVTNAFGKAESIPFTFDEVAMPYGVEDDANLEKRDYMRRIEFVAADLFLQYQQDGCVPFGVGSKLHHPMITDYANQFLSTDNHCITWPQWRTCVVAIDAWWQYSSRASCDIDDLADSHQPDAAKTEYVSTLENNWALLVADLEMAFPSLKAESIKYEKLAYKEAPYTKDEIFDMMKFLLESNNHSGYIKASDGAIPAFLAGKGMTPEMYQMYAEPELGLSYVQYKRWTDNQAPYATVEEAKHAAEEAEQDLSLPALPPAPKSVQHEEISVQSDTSSESYTQKNATYHSSAAVETQDTAPAE